MAAIRELYFRQKDWQCWIRSEWTGWNCCLPGCKNCECGLSATENILKPFLQSGRRVFLWYQAQQRLNAASLDTRTLFYTSGSRNGSWLYTLFDDEKPTARFEHRYVSLALTISYVYRNSYLPVNCHIFFIKGKRNTGYLVHQSDKLYYRKWTSQNGLDRVVPLLKKSHVCWCHHNCDRRRNFLSIFQCSVVFAFAVYHFQFSGDIYRRTSPGRKVRRRIQKL